MSPDYQVLKKWKKEPPGVYVKWPDGWTMIVVNWVKEGCFWLVCTQHDDSDPVFLEGWSKNLVAAKTEAMYAYRMNVRV